MSRDDDLRAMANAKAVKLGKPSSESGSIAVTCRACGVHLGGMMFIRDGATGGMGAAWLAQPDAVDPMMHERHEKCLHALSWFADNSGHKCDVAPE